MYAVTGATGNVGRSLVRTLAAAGVAVTATSRGITAADVPSDVAHVRSDLLDLESLRPVLDGASALFLQNGGPSAPLLDPHAILSAAKASGIERVVLLSTQGVGTRPDSPFYGVVAGAIEEAVRTSGLSWTILRPGGFHSNTFAWADSVRTHRTVTAPFADTALPTIDPDDIAEVAALTLLDDAHAGRTYELTGPALITPREQAAALAAALGEAVEFVEQTHAEARTQMLHGMPESVVDTTLAILGAPTPAEQRISPDIERLLGRAPRTFADWAQRYAGAFH
ncbi:NAD(P)H-binding protein [Streptomyces sp. NRRL WC-3742]|uniref:NAD(P)H-binding protein n=1 Tax=Streptomyces sp. NRRL WC-3742 TaxID=1463934 RepID=UPI0004C93E8A|nr:NAD(P)H-binding protein [Streptomyces sp. NRRL WC-3742]